MNEFFLKAETAVDGKVDTCNVVVFFKEEYG